MGKTIAPPTVDVQSESSASYSEENQNLPVKEECATRLQVPILDFLARGRGGLVGGLVEALCSNEAQRQVTGARIGRRRRAIK